MAPEILENGELRKNLADYLNAHKSDLYKGLNRLLKEKGILSDDSGNIYESKSELFRQLREPIDRVIYGISTDNYNDLEEWVEHTLQKLMNSNLHEKRSWQLDSGKILEKIQIDKIAMAMSNLLQAAVDDDELDSKTKALYRQIIEHSMEEVLDTLRDTYNGAKSLLSHGFSLNPDIVAVIGGPSGVGKDSVTFDTVAFLNKIKGLNAAVLVRDKTRKPRTYEVDGIHSHFITEQEFHEKENKGEYMADFHFGSHFYGYCKNEFDKLKGSNNIILIPTMDIPTLSTLKSRIRNAISIVMLAGTNNIEQRLIRRESYTDSKQRADELDLRLKYLPDQLRNFMGGSTNADYVILNTSGEYFPSGSEVSRRYGDMNDTIEKLIAILKFESNLSEADRQKSPAEKNKLYVDGLTERLFHMNMDEVKIALKKGTLQLDYDQEHLKSYINSFQELKRVKKSPLEQFFPLRVMGFDSAYGRRTILFDEKKDSNDMDLVDEFIAHVLDGRWCYRPREFTKFSELGLVRTRVESSRGLFSGGDVNISIKVRDGSAYYLSHNLVPLDAVAEKPGDLPVYALIVGFSDLTAQDHASKLNFYPLSKEDLNNPDNRKRILSYEINERIALNNGPFNGRQIT